MLRLMRTVLAVVTAFWLSTSGVVSAAEIPQVAAGARAYPNPARDVIHIAFGSAVPNSIIVPSDQLRVTVHNVTGRLVSKLRDGRVDYGVGDHGEITWDGRMESGQRAPSGFYYIRIVRNGQVSVLKVWFIR